MPAVVGCSLLGFCPSVLQGQPLLWCRAAESRQEAEWEPACLRRLAGRWGCPVSMEATPGVQGTEGSRIRERGQF